MSEYILETNRLFLREIEASDENDLFELDSDPEVHLYIENNPVTSIEQIRAVIEMLQKQYRENGIARWAVIDKQTLECIGWAGLKYFAYPLNNHSDIYELGYRFKKKHWGLGYATESSKAILKYGFESLNLDTIYAITNPENSNSRKVLSKLGFEHKEVFDYEGDPTDWWKLEKSNYLADLQKEV